MDGKRLAVTIKARCGHYRTESFNCRFLKLGRKKFGPKFLHRKVKFYQDNDCQACFSQERFHAQGIANHLASV